MHKKYAPILIALLLCFAKIPALAQAPSWSVNPANFSGNMNLTAQIYLSNAEVNTGANLLGAFVGNEVRGVASPTFILGEAYYFLTIFSSAAPGVETVTFKVWLASTNTVYSALEQAAFSKNTSLGGYPGGFGIHIMPGDDFPVSWLPIPDDTTLATYPFEAIDLDDYLVSSDNDPVAFSFLPGSNLSVTFSNSTHVLTVTPASPSWTGTDSVQITATETGTSNGFSASQYVRFTVEPNYAPPIFEYFPLQFVQDYLPLPGADLDDRLTFGGDCLDYDVRLTPPLGNTSSPVWTQPGSNTGSMSLVLEVRFGGDLLTGAGRKAAGFVGGQLAGVANPQVVAGKELYFLTLSNVDSGEITIKFYDAPRQFLHEQATGLAFFQSGSAGSFADPLSLDFAPILVAVSPTGEWTTTVLDSAWTGGQAGHFFATDCEVADKRDSVDVTFIVGRCPEQVVQLPSGGNLCLEAEGDAFSVVWYMDGDSVGMGQTFVASQDGFYFYEALDANGCTVVKSCPVSVVPAFGNAPPAEKSAKSANFSQASSSAILPPIVCGNIAVDTIASNNNSTTWYKDADGDHYSSGQTMQSCLSPGAGWYLASQLNSLSIDCNDIYAPIHPGAPELCNALDDDCSGSPESPTNTWTGAGGNVLWSNPGNWSDGFVPLTCQHVLIPAGKNVTVAAGFNAVGKTMKVELSANLTVELTGTLYVKP